MTSCTDSQGVFTQDPEDNLDYTIDFERWLAEQWQAGTVVAAASFRRPKMPTGFEYEATSAGQTGKREPIWPRILGSTISDGSVLWTCRPLSNNSLKAVLASATWTADPGITLGTATISGQRATVFLSGGSDGTDYNVRCEGVMSNGVERNVNFTLQVRREQETSVGR